jgi:hypothetical protein
MNIRASYFLTAAVARLRERERLQVLEGDLGTLQGV